MYIANMAKASQLLGVFALLVSISQISSDLDWANQLGQVSTNILGFSLVSYLTGALVTTLGVGALTIGLGVLIAVTFAISIYLINNYYFSFLFIPRRAKYA